MSVRLRDSVRRTCSAAIGVTAIATAMGSSVDGATINGRIFFSGYQTAFNDERRVISLAAEPVAGGDRYTATVDEQGFFAIEVPADQKRFRVTWESSRPLTTFAIFPVQHPLLDAAQFHQQFRFRPVADLHVDKRDVAALLVRRGDFRQADEVIKQMLMIYSLLGTPQARTWRFKLMQQICTEVSTYQTALGGRDLREDMVRKARDWWQEHVVSATELSPQEGVRALNGWAAFATSAYRPGGQQWPDESVKRVQLRKGPYRDLLREDLAFVQSQLSRQDVREFIAKVRQRPRGPSRPATDREKALAFFEPIAVGHVEALSLLTVMRFLSALAA